jgi:hypothetical protein
LLNPEIKMMSPTIKGDLYSRAQRRPLHAGRDFRTFGLESQENKKPSDHAGHLELISIYSANHVISLIPYQKEMVVYSYSPNPFVGSQPKAKQIFELGPDIVF